jgi:hypothetical protein
MVRRRKYYLKNIYLTIRSKSHEGHYSTRHTDLWSWKILFKKQLFDLEVKGKGPTKVITVCDTPPYGHAPTYQISLTYLERQKCYGLDKKILFKKQLFDLEIKGQGPTKVITVRDTPPYGHAPTYQISSGKTKKLWSGQDLLRRSGRRSGSGRRRKNQTKTICLSLFKGETY